MLGLGLHIYHDSVCITSNSCWWICMLLSAVSAVCLPMLCLQSLKGDSDASEPMCEEEAGALPG